MTLLKYLAAAASTAVVTNAQTDPPLQFYAKINNYMPVVNATIQDQGPFEMNLEVYGQQNFVWSSTCTQDLIVPGANCTESPTFVTEAVDYGSLSCIGPNKSYAQGGYNSTGRSVCGTVGLVQNATHTFSTIQNSYVITNITEDAWNWGSGVASGTVTVAALSNTMEDLQVGSVSGWSLETGPVANQAFAGGSAPSGNVNLYLGGGNYSAIYPATSADVKISPLSDGSFPIGSIGFGVLNFTAGVPDNGWFEQLGFTNESSSAMIAPNFKGLGLPNQYWYQLVNLLYHSSAGIAKDLTCQSRNGGVCTLSKSCANYASLWDYSFKIQWQGASNYMNVPLAAFAVDGINGCNMWIQYLNSDDYSQSDKVIFGSMFLQLYNNWWSFDYSAGTFINETLSMQLSANTTLTGAYIGNAPFTEGTDPFRNLEGTIQTLDVTVDSVWMHTVIQADLGFQGFASFGISLLGNYIQSWSTDCMQHNGGRLSTSCANGPAFVDTYFNTSTYSPSYNISGTYDGYMATGYVYNSSVCLSATSIPIFCTIENHEFLIGDNIYSNNWNLGTDGNAGTIGLGRGSPIWSVLGSPNSKAYDVYLANINQYSEWGPATPVYQPVTNQGVINLNGFDNSGVYNESEPFLTMKPSTSQGHFFRLEEFSFGQTFTDNTKSYKSLLNSNETIYGAGTNLTNIVMNYRGIGLPTAHFEQFNNLLSIASKGQAVCGNFLGGYCLLPQTCDYYNDKGLWSYDFRIKFESNNATNNNYMRIPLSTFASNFQADGGLCAIFVEFLDVNNNDSQQILLGGLFFQAVYAQYNLTGFSTSLKLWRNVNALPGTYLGDMVVPDSAQSAFDVPVIMPEPDTQSEQNGLPTFRMNIQGVSDTSAYYLMDFTQDYTVLWNMDCNQTVTGSGSCENAPTLMSLGFNASDNTTGIIHRVGTFNNAKLGGYVVSGTRYETELCLPNGDCKIGVIYSGENVSQNNWRYDQDGTYGIIGMGPNSFLWNGFADIENNTVTYSLELARVNPLTSVHDIPIQIDGATQSNITFGSANDVIYQGAANVMINAQSDFTYALDNFNFGIVYQNANGDDESQYFFALDNQYPVTFTTNFKGLGLPSNLYLQVVALLEEMTQTEIVCDATTDGICVMPAPCADYESFVDYTFLFNFTDSTNGNYMRVPLATFATNVKGSGGVTKCNVEITYLDSLATQSNNIILGGMFFQEFFGVFNNVYDQYDQASQNAVLYVGQNALYNSYCGNEQLANATNPFVPPTPPTPPNENENIVWIIVLSVLAAILLVGLGFAIYKWKFANGGAGVSGDDTERLNPSGRVTSDEI